MTDDAAGADPWTCRDLLISRLSEPAPGRIQILTGPRQVGKTTLLLELARRQAPRAIYGAADSPESALPGFWDRLWDDAERLAGSGPAVLLIDEIHHVSDWSARLKGRWDRLRRRDIPLHVIVSGSSALRVGRGSRESLAGRFERLTLSHWSARALANVFGLGPEDATDLVVGLGGYPGAMGYRKDPLRWRAYLRDAVIEPAIGRDVLATRAVRHPALLRQVFATAASQPAAIISLQKLQGQLQDRGALETIAHYLDLLADSYLVVALKKYSSVGHRRRAAPPKLVVLNNALGSALHPAGPPDPSAEPARFGAWVENACLAHALNEGQTVRYWREEPLELDAVIEGSWGHWAVEVKTGRVVAQDARALATFTARHPRYRPLLVTDPKERDAAGQLGVAAVSWREFLFDGPPRS